MKKTKYSSMYIKDFKLKVKNNLAPVLYGEKVKISNQNTIRLTGNTYFKIQDKKHSFKTAMIMIDKNEKISFIFRKEQLEVWHECLLSEVFGKGAL